MHRGHKDSVSVSASSSALPIVCCWKEDEEENEEGGEGDYVQKVNGTEFEEKCEYIQPCMCGVCGRTRDLGRCGCVCVEGNVEGKKSLEQLGLPQARF